MRDRILLVDDHDVILEGIRSLVERSGKSWEICGTAHNGQEGVETAHALKPDIVVLDISMPVMNGIDATKAIIHDDKDAKVLLFTMHDSERMEQEAREAGARGIVTKSQAGRSLIRAIGAILGGATYFGSVSDAGSPNPPRKKKLPGMGGLNFVI